MDIIAFKQKGRPIAFLLIISFSLIHLSCLKMDPFLKHQVESDDGGHLVSIVALGPGRRILIKAGKINSDVDCQTLTKYNATFVRKFYRIFR